MKGPGGADAVWTSKVLDAGLRATFGRLAWRSEGQVEIETRTGNTETPDTTWSAWSKPLTAPGDTSSPPGRYVQMRARFGKDAKAVVREVVLSFVTDNARAIVTSIDAVAKNQPRGALKVERVGLHGNFFDLGGHSLLMVQVHEKLSAAFGRRFSMVELFQHPTVASLAKYIAQQSTPDASQDAKQQARDERARKQLQAMQQQALKAKAGRGKR